MTEDVEPISDEDRIRNNLDYWSMDESLGTYRADRDDYGKVDVSVLRDLQLLRSRLDATTEKLAEARATASAVIATLRSQRDEAKSRLAAAEAALRDIADHPDDTREVTLGIIRRYFAAAAPPQEAEHETFVAEDGQLSIKRKGSPQEAEEDA